jgi:NADPH-dependent 2,4-dienoyl-CoA reductase/sulfur reductase-like enzyme
VDRASTLVPMEIRPTKQAPIFPTRRNGQIQNGNVSMMKDQRLLDSQSSLEDDMNTPEKSDSYDLVVLGGGPAGGAAAEAALHMGARVVVVERDRLGGT